MIRAFSILQYTITVGGGEQLEVDNPFFHLSGKPASEGGAFTRLISTPRFQFLLLLVLATFLCTVKLDSGGLMGNDECFYAQMAKEAVRTGDWLTLRFAGIPYHQNPWLHMWIIASSYKIFGVSDWAARFPTCVQTVLIIIMTYLLAQWLFDNAWISMLSASSLLLCDYFFKFARKAHMDHLMTLLFLVAVITFIAGRRRHQAWYLLTGAAIALSVLTKSILGLFPMITIASYILIRREWAVLKKPFFWLAVVVMILAGSSWYIYEYRMFGRLFVDKHIRWLIYYRSAFGGIMGEDKTLLTYLSKMGRNVFYFARDSHIWFLAAACGTGMFFVSARKAISGFRRSPEEGYLLVLWFLVPVAVMSLAGEFKSWYLMPVFVPMVILTALFLAGTVRRPRRLRILNLFFIALLFIHLLVLVVTPYFSLDMKHEVRHPGIRKLATKVRMLDLTPDKRTVHFPASREIAERNGMEQGLFSYWSIAPPWAFYSDHPLLERSKPYSLEETRMFLDGEGGVCLTTGRGYDVISGDRSLPYEVVGRAVDGKTEYVVCCSRSLYERLRKRIETDFSRPPLYRVRDY